MSTLPLITDAFTEKLSAHVNELAENGDLDALNKLQKALCTLAIDTQVHVVATAIEDLEADMAEGLSDNLSHADRAY